MTRGEVGSQAAERSGEQRWASLPGWRRQIAVSTVHTPDPAPFAGEANFLSLRRG